MTVAGVLESKAYGEVPRIRVLPSGPVSEQMTGEIGSEGHTEESSRVSVAPHT